MKHKEKLIIGLYYLRKVIIGLLCFLSVAGVSVILLSIVVEQWSSEITSLSFSTGISILLLIWVWKYKKPVEMFNNFKKERGKS